MPRPTTKTELLEAASAQYEKLLALFNSMTDSEQNATFLFEDRDRNLRDVLVHLYEWHRLLLNWVHANHTDGNPAPFLPPPYTWKTYGDMNVELIWKKHQRTPLAEARTLLDESHGEVMRLIENFSDTELFTKQYFSWTGSTSLGGYCVSATASHYDWAMKKIKNHIKTYRQQKT